ncbi:MAG: response regulator [Halothiobacillaceae bacterium]
MSKNILVVDDSAAVRQVVSLSLKQAGHRVVEAVDGRDALGKLDQCRFHLVISDVNMPNLDGIGFVTRMKSHDAHRFTPVLMLTTESGEARKAEGRAAGVRAWLVKPFSPDVLLSAVGRLA